MDKNMGWKDAMDGRGLRVGVTGTGSLIGQAIIKSLLASNLCRKPDIVGYDYFKNTVGSFWVGANIILPDILKNKVENNWLKVIIDTAKSEKLNLMFVGLDFELKLFARYKEVIEKNTGCRVIVSDSKVVEIADDKYLTYKFLKDNGFYYPKTFLPHEVSVNEIPFPCILKPRTGSRSKGFFVIRDKHELMEKIKEINNPIVQELIGKPDSEYTCGAICLDGEIKEIIVLKRTLKDGNTETACFSNDTPKIIYDYVYAIATELKPYGACNFQLRLDEDNIPKLFEINARHSGTTYMRAMFGLNEVEYIVRYLKGLGTKKAMLKEGVVKRFYDEVFINGG